MKPKDINDVGGISLDDCEPFNPYESQDFDESPPPDESHDFGGSNEPPIHCDTPDFDEEFPPSAGIPPEPPFPYASAPSIPGGNENPPQPNPGIMDQITPEVEQLIRRIKRVENLWNSHGKTWKIPGENGEEIQLPSTSAGYDLSFACELVKRDIRNKSEISTALWYRPDDAAQLRGKEYIYGVTNRALKLVANPNGDQSIKGDFTVEEFYIYNSDPASYKIVVDGVGVRLSVDELFNARRFATRFLQRLRRIPSVPRKPVQWENLVNTWLANAIIVELPPEASLDTMTREILTDIIQKMPTGESLSDLDLGRTVVLDGYRAIKTRPLLRTYCESEEKMGTHQLCRHLRAMGWETKVRRAGNKTERVWLRPIEKSNGTDGNAKEFNDQPSQKGENDAPSLSSPYI